MSAANPITIDYSTLKQFTEEFRKRVARSEHGLAYNVNRTAYYVAKGAQEHTPLADKSAIEKLGITTYITVSAKGKTLKRPKPVYHYGGRARDIWVGGYVNKHGRLPPELASSKMAAASLKLHLATESHVKDGIRAQLKRDNAKSKSIKRTGAWKSFRDKTETLRDQAGAAERKIRAVIASRLRRRGFLKSGWYPAIIALARAIGISADKDSNSKLLKRDNGAATIAKHGRSPEATIIHNAHLEGKQSGRPYQQLVDAMNYGLRKEMAKMVAYQEKQLEENFK